MSGCPFLKYDWVKDCEVCKITAVKTNGAVKCDFGYEKDCAIYRAAEEEKDVGELLRTN